MLSTRWPNTYDAMAERILTDAAFHTSYKLIHSAGGSEKQDSDEPVVLALKALVQARNIHVFTHHFPLNWFIDEHFRECPMTLLRAETFSGSQGQESMNPHVSLQRMSDGFEMPPEDQRMPEQQRLASFVERALESATKMLLRGDASEWIDVFWTLCILVLVHGDLERAAGFTDTLLTAQNELNRALENLTALYLHCCGDLHPLNDDEIDPEWVELVIGSHTGEPTKVWTQYVDYNSFWTGSRDDDWHVTSVKSFLKHLENYMNGWHLF
ncbi:hypothetical protein EJ04DRAFT_508894 [Polyplosphaeria fusca]|uniref:Uncharacterized protein n=1 Tax=Polyplosphaeria fusca TaxID=682080 RepID=A0A9P4R4I2_9PLEO|nr:hypothetical protein EJ04DRAFT_508894 [Polyplosphaeria fusca]